MKFGFVAQMVVYRNYENVLPRIEIYIRRQLQEIRCEFQDIESIELDKEKDRYDVVVSAKVCLPAVDDFEEARKIISEKLRRMNAKLMQVIDWYVK